MATLTSNYLLTKPVEASESADINVINTNMDIIDTQLRILETKVNKTVNFTGRLLTSVYDGTGKRPGSTYSSTTPDIQHDGKRNYLVTFRGYGISDGGGGQFTGHGFFFQYQVGAGAWVSVASDGTATANVQPFVALYWHNTQATHWFFQQVFTGIATVGPIRFRCQEVGNVWDNNLVDNTTMAIYDAGAFV